MVIISSLLGPLQAAGTHAQHGFYQTTVRDPGLPGGNGPVGLSLTTWTVAADQWVGDDGFAFPTLQSANTPGAGYVGAACCH
jgi:hypothetical protein